MSRHEELMLVARRPSLWDRVTRSLRLGPYNTKDKALASLFGGGSTISGVAVNETTALRSSAVWSAVTMISDDIASLPLFLYRRLPSGGKDRYETHPLYRLLHDSPNPEMDSMVWRRTMQTHVLLWQNAYAEIERDGAGRPVALWPLVPERVSVFRDGRTLRYRVQNDSSPDAILDAANMIHLVGQSHDGSEGSSLVRQARESFGLGLAAERFGASFFGNGATFGGVISVDGPKPDIKSEKVTKETLEARHQGVDRAYRILALYNGAKYVPTGVKPNEGQFNETRVFQIREVARWFKMPPHKLGDLADATYSNVEQMDAAYMASCIRPWLKLWEQQLSRKLISRLERTQQFIEHDTHGFLSVDAAGRAALYGSEFNVGSITPNEIRGYENRDPVEGGDRAFVRLDMLPLDKVDAYWEAKIEAEKAAKAPPPAPPAPKAGTSDEDAEAMRRAIVALEAAIESERAVTRQAVQRAEDLSAAQAEAEKARDEARAELAHTLELYAGAQQAAAQTQADHAHEIEAHASTREALEDATTRAAAMGEQADIFKAQVDALRAERDALADGRETERLLREAAEAALVEGMAAAHAERDAAIADKATAEAERDATHAEALRSVAEAMIQREAAEAEAAAANLRAESAAAAAADASEQRQAAERDRDGVRQREAQRMTAVIAAHRALMVDALKRLIVKEADRARRHQATPQKIRAWAETFYPDHVETCAEVLRPVVAAHLAWMQSDADVDAEARALAEAHVGTSRQQLRDVLAVEDYHPALEKVLQRWEQRRPEAVADRFVQEGVAYVRSLQ